MATWKLNPDTGQVSGTNSNMPLVVIPSDITGVGAITLAEAQSSRFYTDSSLVTEVPREVVSADELHFKGTSVTSSSEFWWDYDGVRADYAVTGTYGRNAVWSDYEFVAHLGEGDSTAAGFYKDSTGKGRDMTLIDANGSSFASTGQVGGAFTFAGIPDVIKSPAVDIALTNSTVSIWVNPDITLEFRAYVASKDAPEDGTNSFQLDFDNSNNYRIRYAGLADIIFGPVTAGWDYLTAVQGVSRQQTYLNGSLNTSNTTTTIMQFYRFKLGENRGDNAYYDGAVDEYRVTSEIRSADWISTEYNNQKNNAAFWVATSAGGGGGATRNAIFAFGGM